MKTSSLIVLFTFMTVLLLANMVNKQEFEHIQPDGSSLTLYVSGDEYYHRVHDIDGFTVLQHPETGYAVYAIPEGNGIVASEYRVGRVDPHSLGINPGLTIDLKQARETSAQNQRNRDAGVRATPVGTINNILAFIRFHDQSEFPTTSNWASYSNIFNLTGSASLKDFYTTVSNSQLTINSNLYPAANGSGYVVSIQVSHDRGYYSPYNATTNTIGYQTDAQKNSRHSAWITEMIGLLNPYVPDGLDLDSDDDGVVDALTFIIRGSTDAWGDLLWPAHWTWGGSLGTMNGANVSHYVLNFQGGIGLSVVCHEMGHMIGAPDLYHYYDAPMGSIYPWNTISPAYQWCLMDNDDTQHWLTYMKWKYGTWFPTIPTITPTSTATTYTLTAVDQSPYSCYKIQSLDPNQFYMLEYRRQSGLYDVNVPGSGLIITRINTDGINGNSQGPPDEVYVYRPGGDVDSNGSPASAFYSEQSGRTEINNFTDPKPWTWVNTTTTNDGNLVIFDVGPSGGTTISFKVRNEPFNVWKGTTSTNWSVASNWSCGVPTATSDVIIPTGCARYPILTAAGNCETLVMQTGTTLNISTQTLNVAGQMDIAGQLIMNFSAGRLNVTGDLNWLSGSSAQVTNSPEITIQGDMDFRAGSSVQLGGGLVQFTGTSNSYIRCYTSGGVWNLRSNKTTPAYLAMSAVSDDDLYVYGNLNVYSGSTFDSFDDHSVRVYGNLTSAAGATLQLDYGTIRFDGASASSINIQATDYLFNLTLAKTGSAQVNMAGDLSVSGSVNIATGVLNTAGYDISLGRNWVNSVGPAGFLESTGQVIINGSVAQTINSEDFNILVLNKSGSEMIIPASAQVSCQQYDWQAGAYRVDGGWFVVQDLIDNGIYGTITLNSGHIVYTQDVSNWIDLRGDLTIHDGGFTINGGSGPAYWPYLDSASITMDGGILDFTGSGILISNAPLLTDNISGGTIRTPQNFIINRPDFNPTGGELELYGSGDAYITSTAGSNLFSLKINKVASKEQGDILPVYYDRNGRVIPITRTNTVTATTDVDLNGNFTLSNGSFVAPALMQVAGDWYNYMGPSLFLEGNGVVEFNGAGHQYCYHSEDFYTMNINNGAALRLSSSSTDVTCVNYDWTSGGIDVLSGTFTANDLVDNGIYGGFWNNTGGVINLYQDSASYPDLNGYLYNYGGTYNLHGGNGSCYWSYGGNAGIEMSSGTIDWKDRGIVVSDNTHTFTLNVTGGTIRTAGGYTSYREDTVYAGGTFEFYGTGDAVISPATGDRFYNLNINKAAATRVTEIPARYELREGDRPIDYRTNSATLLSDVTCAYTITITSGTLNVGAFTLEAYNDIHVYGALNMTAAGNIISGDDFYWFGSSSGTISAGNVIGGAEWRFDMSSSVNMTGSTTSLNADYDANILCNSPNSWFGSLILNGNGGGEGSEYFLDPYSMSILKVTGDLTIYGENILTLGELSADIDGNVTLYSTGGIDIGDGSSFIIDGAFDHQGDVYIGPGDFIVHGIYTTSDTASMTINSGLFRNDIPWRGSESGAEGRENGTDRTLMAIRGAITMTSGVYEITDNSVQLYAHATRVWSGGLVRIGVGFIVTAANAFNQNGGTLELMGSHNPALEVSNGNYIHNLTINLGSSNRAYLQDEITINGNLLINTGGIVTNNNAMFIKGTWTNNAGQANFSEGTSTITFFGNSDATGFVTDETVYNLILNNSSTIADNFELSANVDLTVSNDLTITDGTFNLKNNSNVSIARDLSISAEAGLNAINGSNIHISVGRNWTDANTSNTSTKGYSPGTSEVILIGSTGTIVTIGQSVWELYKLTVNKTTVQTVSFSKPVKVNTSCSLDNCVWTDTVGGLIHEFRGDLTFGPAGDWNPANNNTIACKGTAFQNLTIQSGSVIRHLYVDKSVGNTLALGSTILGLNGGNINVVSGTLDLNHHLYRTTGNINIGNGGKISVDDDATLQLANGKLLDVLNGGTLEFIGTPGHLATLGPQSGYFNCYVESGGDISASYALFEYLGTNGVYVKSGATVDPANAFNYCTFRNGISGGRLLMINSSQNLTITGAVFPTNTWSGTWNVAKTVDQGTLSFIGYSGDFAGEMYENDSFGRINWIAMPDVPTPTITRLTSPERIQLSWTYPIPVTQFRIYRCLTPDGTFTQVGTSATTSWSEAVPGLHYFYKVTAEQ